MVRASGGHVRRVGMVTGTTVDWQPLPTKPPPTCQTPPGSTLLASSDTATLSADSAGNTDQIWTGSQAAMYCLRSDGRERVLGFIPPYLDGLLVRKGAVAGPYAALLFDGGGKPPYCQAFIDVRVYDLRTASELPNPERREIGSNGPCAVQASGDQLVLGSDAVTAVHVTLVHPCNGLCGYASVTVEQIEASDSTGVHTLDSVTEPDGSPTALTNLTLTGLTWEHNGTLRSAQLQP